MSKRVTIMIDDAIDRKIRLYQAKMIQQTSQGYSYSKAINDILSESL